MGALSFGLIFMGAGAGLMKASEMRERDQEKTIDVNQGGSSVWLRQ